MSMFCKQQDLSSRKAIQEIQKALHLFHFLCLLVVLSLVVSVGYPQCTMLGPTFQTWTFLGDSHEAPSQIDDKAALISLMIKSDKSAGDPKKVIPKK